MTEYVPSERGMPIRFPSTANLAINSIDRDDNQSSANFSITKQSNILSGYFTRIAVNEIVMDWGIPNVISGVNNDFTVVVGATTTTVLIDTGFYTVAECLNAIVVALNASLGAGSFSVVPNARGGAITKTTGTFLIRDTPLSIQLNVQISVVGGTQTPGTSFTAFSPLLLNQKYIDIVSPLLTATQNLQDADTSSNSRTILYRFMFGWDDAPTYDSLNYPIIQGYRAFLQRRSIAFPKQIKYDNELPIGQITIQVYDDDGEILNIPSKDPSNLSSLLLGEMEFNINLLVSEV